MLKMFVSVSAEVLHETLRGQEIRDDRTQYLGMRNGKTGIVCASASAHSLPSGQTSYHTFYWGTAVCISIAREAQNYVTIDILRNVMRNIHTRACAHYVMAPKFQWEPFWLVTQRDPQNDLTANQNRVNYDVFAQAPLRKSHWPLPMTGSTQ